MKYRRRILILTTLFFIVLSCSRNELLVDTSGIEVSFDVINVDSLYFDASNEEINEIHDRLMEDLGSIYEYEISMNIQKSANEIQPSDIYNFYNNEYIKELEKEKIKLKEDTQKQLKKVEDGFKHLKYHFEELQLPKQIILINKMFSGIELDESQVSVGLEKYINQETKIIKEIPSEELFQWQKEAMNIDFLARDILFRWIQASLFEEKDENLAFHIIQAGKLLYILNASFPNEDGAYILRYSLEDYSWAIENEIPFWEYLVREEMLFKNNIRDKTNFLNEGPYTVGLPEKGPDRLGQFLGFRIVKQFMKSNKELTLQDLIDTEYNTILQSYEIN